MSNDRLMIVIAIITMLFAAGQFAIAWRTAQPKRKRPITHWKAMKIGLNITLLIMVFMGFWMIYRFVFGDGEPSRLEVGNLGIGIMLLIESLLLKFSFRSLERDREILARVYEMDARFSKLLSRQSER